MKAGEPTRCSDTSSGDAIGARERETPLDTKPPYGHKLRPMKKLLVLIVVVALAAFAVKKLQDA